MDNKNRIYYIVGGTIAVGLLLAFLVFAFSGGIDESPVIPPPDMVDSPIIHHVVIEKKIDSLSQHNVTPTKYTTLKSEISSGFNAGMYPNSIKSNLDNRLADAYSKAVIAKINNELSKNPINQNEINVYLSHLASIGLASNTTSEIKNKLKDYNYWTSGITNKVNSFTSKSFDVFNDNTYTNLKTELEQQNGISADIKKHPAVVSTKNKLLHQLKTYYQNYVEYEVVLDNF